MEKEYNIADKLFDSGNYLDAFEIFKKISKSNHVSNFEISDALNMMGVIILIDPNIDPEDESGFKYFSKSIDFNPENIDALLNIIGGFGLAVNNHRDTEKLNLAINTIHSINYNFSSQEKVMINQKIKLSKLLKN